MIIVKIVYLLIVVLGALISFFTTKRVKKSHSSLFKGRTPVVKWLGTILAALGMTGFQFWPVSFIAMGISSEHQSLLLFLGLIILPFLTNVFAILLAQKKPRNSTLVILSFFA